jgi:hypothetical protein
MMFDKLRRIGFDVKMVHHAEAILAMDLPQAASEIEGVLAGMKIPIEELIRGGGGETDNTQRLRSGLAAVGWVKQNFVIEKIINGRSRSRISHEIDHMKEFEKGTVAMELEWNNKDPFFDRDLENFQRLHAEGGISVGVVVTRGSTLQEALPKLVERFAVEESLGNVGDLRKFYNPTDRQRTLIERQAASLGSFSAGWAKAFVSDKFGEATTHWNKLQARIDRGVGNPCPLILIGIPAVVVRFPA